MKKIAITLMAVLLSVTISSAAFASQQTGKTLYFDNLKSVSYGTHGHYWTGDIDDKELLAKVRKLQRLNRFYSDYNYKYGYYYDVKVNTYYHINYAYRNDHSYNSWDFDCDRDGQWHFYKDANGKLHYFYLDPDREYEWNRYRDKDGVTQYYYQDKGWK